MLSNVAFNCSLRPSSPASRAGHAAAEAGGDVCHFGGATNHSLTDSGSRPFHSSFMGESKGGSWKPWYQHSILIPCTQSFGVTKEYGHYHSKVAPVGKLTAK